MNDDLTQSERLVLLEMGVYIGGERSSSECSHPGNPQRLLSERCQQRFQHCRERMVCIVAHHQELDALFHQVAKGFCGALLVSRVNRVLCYPGMAARAWG